MNDFKATDLFIGTVPAEDYGYKRGSLRVTIDVEITHTDRAAQTIHHGHADNPARFAISGAVWNPRLTDHVSGGQITGVLSQLNTFAPGFDAAKAARLAELWQRWHLNDMRAACAHQTVIGHGSDALDQTEPCPETGYRYGSAWLAEELPEGFEDELRSLLPAS